MLRDTMVEPTSSGDLLAQIMAIPPSRQGIEMRPARATMASGEVIDRALCIDARELGPTSAGLQIAQFLGERRPKMLVALEDVARIEESPYRMPPAMANRLYEEGESGMGYYALTVILRDGRTIAQVTSCLDFPALPEAATKDDIADVLHKGRSLFPDRKPGPDETGPPYRLLYFRSHSHATD